MAGRLDFDARLAFAGSFPKTGEWVSTKVVSAAARSVFWVVGVAELYGFGVGGGPITLSGDWGNGS